MFTFIPAWADQLASKTDRLGVCSIATTPTELGSRSSTWDTSWLTLNLSRSRPSSGSSWRSWRGERRTLSSGRLSSNLWWTDSSPHQGIARSLILTMTVSLPIILDSWIQVTVWFQLLRPNGSYDCLLSLWISMSVPVWSISMSRTFPRSCYGVSYAIKNQLVASKAPY